VKAKSTRDLYIEGLGVANDLFFLELIQKVMSVVLLERKELIARNFDDLKTLLLGQKVS